MANYTPTFTKPYPNGWVDKPSKTTPATAAIMNSYDTAIAALEAYLRDNVIDTVSVSVEQFPSDGRQWLGTITVGSNQYKIYMPSLKYENSVSDGTKIGVITLGEQSFDVYTPASSTGGSTVSVVPKTLTGTNIAEITVDGTTYQLYAPAGGGGGSTVTAEATLTEGTQIGKITIDGVETILYAPTASAITVDNELSATSENPVQNKVVKAEFDQVNSNLSNLKVSDIVGGKNLILNTVYGFIAVDKKINIDNSSTSYIFYAQAGKTYSFSGDVTPTAQGVRFARVSSINPKTNEPVSDFNPIADGVSTFTTNETGYYMLYVYNTKTSGIKFQIEKGTQATDYEPYIPSVKMLAEKNAQQNDSLSVLGKCKNLLKPTLQTTTNSGVTCTNNGDGTYTLKGTSTNSGEWNFKVGSATVEKGKKYKIIGFENPTMNARLKADTSNINENESQIFNAADNKEEVYIKFYGNVTFNNEIVKPMLTTNLNATYDDFVPYTGDGDTLTADVATLNSDLSDIKNGTTPVAKAVADEDGNNIKSTYAKKTETSETVTEDVNVVLNSDLFDSTYSDITCVRIGKLCVLSFTIRVKNTISSTINKIVLMSIVGGKYQPKKLSASTGRRQIFQGFAVGNYDENGKQSESLNNTVRIITSSDSNYTEIITRDKDRINWSGYVQGQIMWVTD